VRDEKPEDEVRALEAANRDLVKALKAFVWLDKHACYIRDDPERFAEFFEAVVGDAKDAIARAEAGKIVTKPRLIQLPDGSWEDPDDVSRVEVPDGTVPSRGGYDASVVAVVRKDGSRRLIEYLSGEKACEARDAIAGLVNEARGYPAAGYGE
jgi:hypothetical protein